MSNILKDRNINKEQLENILEMYGDFTRYGAIRPCHNRIMIEAMINSDNSSETVTYSIKKFVDDLMDLDQFVGIIIYGIY